MHNEMLELLNVFSTCSLRNITINYINSITNTGVRGAIEHLKSYSDRKKELIKEDITFFIIKNNEFGWINNEKSIIYCEFSDKLEQEIFKTSIKIKRTDLVRVYLLKKFVGMEDLLRDVFEITELEENLNYKSIEWFVLFERITSVIPEIDKEYEYTEDKTFH